MTELRQRQADLVAALTGIGPPPPGFDTYRIEVAREALLRKRSGEVARHWPMLRAALGSRFGAEFAAWAAHRPTAGGWRDGFDFAIHLSEQSVLAEIAQLELAERKLRWRYDGTAPPRRRRLPSCAVVGGRLLIAVGGRLLVFGRTDARPPATSGAASR